MRPKPVRIPIKDRHVFITGGSSGIGFALAKSAALQGARVSVLARNRQRLEEAKQSIKISTGCEISIFSADVRDSSAVKNAIDEAGDVDVLICNQGVFVPLELEKQEIEDVKLMVDVNLIGTFHLIKAALPGMKRRTRETGEAASIAIMSSQAGQVGVYGYTAYSASKFGLRGLAESLQHEVISDNIHVSLIFPPDTQTPGFDQEHKRRPELTSIISASSGAMSADDVAKKSLDGLKRGQFTIPCNFDGAMLAIATAGMSPQRSSATALCEVMLIGFMRAVALGYQRHWFSQIEKYHSKNKTRPNNPLHIPIKNRHVFISGGSSGIGFALAKSAALQGARVSILARDKQRLKEAQESIKLSTGYDIFIYSADVRDASAVKETMDKAGDVDVLICNHGVFVPVELEKQETEEIKFIIDVNLMGTFRLIKAALPGMKRRARETGEAASIALMSSQAGQVGVYGYGAYSASKFGLRGLAEALQHEVISDDIFVSMIFPPDTKTPGFDEEHKRRPELTSIISASSGAMSADDVAKKTFDGLKRGKFTIPCNFDGRMLAIATAGMSPQGSSMTALCEVLLAGFMRALSLGYQWWWFAQIEKYNARKKSV